MKLSFRTDSHDQSTYYSPRTFSSSNQSVGSARRFCVDTCRETESPPGFYLAFATKLKAKSVDTHGSNQTASRSWKTLRRTMLLPTRFPQTSVTSLSWLFFLPNKKSEA